MINGILLRYFVNSIYGSFFIVVIIIIRMAVKNRVPKKYFCILWILAALRLVIPVSVESSFGVLPPVSDVFGMFKDLEATDRMYPSYGYDADVTKIPYTEDQTIDTGDSLSEADVEEIKMDSGRGTDIKKKYTSQDVFSTIWFLGTVLMLGYMTAGMILTGRKVRFAVPDTYRICCNPDSQEETEVKVYTAEDVSVPFLYGLVSPRIFLPYEFQEDDLIHVIRHELAHIKRGDHILKPAYFAVLAIYWYNPLVWAAFRMFSADMEMACDEMVIDDYDQDLRNEYVLALLSAAGKTHDMRIFSLPFGRPPVKDRIEGVLKYKKSGKGIRCVSIIVILAVSIVFSSVHVSAGQDEIIITDYDSVIPVTDEADGERYLLIPYHKDPAAYVMTELDDTLETEVKEKSDQFWYERPLSDYTIKRDESTDLEYIVKKGDALWEGHVLLRNYRDRKKYDALAQDYSDRYTEVITDADIGYIYAGEEVKGLAERHENGFLYLQTGTLMYIDLSDKDVFGWRLALTTDEYMRLEKWMSESMDNSFDHTDIEAWKPVLDKLDIDYGANIDTDSKQYKAAYDALMGDETDFPPRGMTAEQAQEQIRYNMKQFDEDGDPVVFGAVPGMLVTEENDKDRRTIIQIPDEIRQTMFDLNKEEFIKWNGMGGDTERSDVYRMYQEQAPKEDRLKGTWTLGQYERIYNQCFANTVRSADPGWQAGDDFDMELIADITRDQIEKCISSDGSELKYDPEMNKD